MSTIAMSREELRTLGKEQLTEFADWLQDPAARVLWSLLAGEMRWIGQAVWSDDGDKEWPFLKGRRTEVEEIVVMLRRVMTGELLEEGKAHAS